jgi:hypothetical protein
MPRKDRDGEPDDCGLASQKRPRDHGIRLNSRKQLEITNHRTEDTVTINQDDAWNVQRLLRKAVKIIDEYRLLESGMG